MQKKEGEEGRVHGGIHPQEAGTKKRAEIKAAAGTVPAAAAAEDHYEKAKDFGTSALHDAKESASHGLGAASYYATAQGAQAKDTISHGVTSGSHYVADTAVAAVEKGQ